MIISNWDRFLVDEIESTEVVSGLMVWSLGGPSVAVKSRETTIYIDPYFGGSIPPDWMRMISVPIDPADIRQARAVLSTHNHQDHCHKETLLGIAANNPETTFIGPSSSVTLMKEFGLASGNITQVAHGDTVTVGDMEITALTGKDWADDNALCYVIQSDAATFFDGGDTLYFDRLKEYGEMFDIDAAKLAVAGPYKGQKIYLDEKDSVRAATDLGVRHLIPQHWDIWKCVALDPQKIVSEADRQNAPFSTHILSMGDSFHIKRRQS